MKLSIISDGTTHKTEVIDTVSGQVLDNVTRIEIVADAKYNLVNAIIHLTDVALALQVDDLATLPPIVSAAQVKA